MTQDIDETATLTESEADPTETELVLVGDAPVVLDDCENANNWSLIPNQLAFNSGGTHQVLEGDTIQGNISGANAYVEYIGTSGGSWPSGNAIGVMYLSNINGNFQAETLNHGNNTDVCTIGGVPVIPANAAIALDTYEFSTGNGSILVTIPPSANNNLVHALPRCIANAANFSDPLKYLKFNGKGNAIGTPSRVMAMFLGENSYRENRFACNNILYNWGTIQQDISNIANANRNAVTEFAIIVKSLSFYEATFNIDYVRASLGPRQLKASDGERAFLVYPKCYVSVYSGSGNNSNQTITLARKGIPNSIEILADGIRPYIWLTGMGNDVMRANAANDTRMTYVSYLLTDVVDGCFTVTGQLNTLDLAYRYRVMWSD